MASLALSPQVFAILRTLVEEKTGLHYADADRALFAEKVSVRAQDAGFESLLDYYYRLRYDDPDGTELRTLVDALVVGETYFFREFEQLQRAADLLAALPGRPRVWSAACSSGEEPLTLAMLLEERGLLGRVEIVASDVSARALAKAAQNRYSTRSVRDVPRPDLAAKWLDRTPETVRVRPGLHEAVDWRQVNLVDRAAVAALGLFDVILCRNALIYFNDERVAEVVATLAGALRPQGTLFVGISESLLRFGTGLQCEETGGVFLYRKAD